MSVLLNQTIRTINSSLNSIWIGFMRMATENKNLKFTLKIGTHSGTFHCDEALACFMLKQLPQYKNADIIRTRDSAILDTCDIVVDVGGVYNPKTHRYDHHQRSFNETLSTIRPDISKNKTIKLSSAGLVYIHFGVDILSEILKEKNHTMSTVGLHNLFKYIYDSFIEEIDAIDNGVPICQDKPNYRITTHLSARIHRLNPNWNAINKEPLDKLFEKAMNLVGNEFIEHVIDAATVWWPAKEIVKKSILNRMKVHESGEIVVLEEQCPWKQHIFNLEDELDLVGKLKFVIFHDINDKTWRVQGIPILPDSFICRLFLREEWRGIKDEKLEEISNIPGMVFCHSMGFIGGNRTKAGAIEMANASLKSVV